MKYVWWALKAICLAILIMSDSRAEHIIAGVVIGQWLQDDFSQWVARQIHRMATK